MSFNTDKLLELSQMIVCGQITYKLDHIATVYINCRYYFNVYRRYNSPYNIVIEDYNNDIYLHQDHTIRTSLKTILCLSEHMSNNIYTINATSYKHNGQIPSVSYDITDIHWTDIHTNYVSIILNIGGNFNDVQTPITQQEVPFTPHNQTIQPIIASQSDVKLVEQDAANILLTIAIPKFDNEFKQSESDGPTLSMSFADVLRRNSIPLCDCEMSEDSSRSSTDSEDSSGTDSEDSSGTDSEDSSHNDTDSENSEDSEDSEDSDIYNENKYTVLRSGTIIRKTN